jgi:hypothetical protein
MSARPASGATENAAEAPGHAGACLIVNRPVLAALCGVHADTITHYANEGMPVRSAGGRGQQGQYCAIECLRWWRARRAPGTAEQERTRHLKAMADKIEQEIRHRAGETVETAEVDERWAGMVLAMRERILALPTLALQRGLLASPGAEDGLIQLVDDALSELAHRGDRAERA